MFYSFQDDFGLEKIEVRDNGSGLTPEDTAVMGQVHYTSKIQHLDDMGEMKAKLPKLEISINH